jgi:uncharacterized membrane protein YiaA
MNVKSLLATARLVALWVWKNRINLFITAFFTILFTKWVFGRIATQQVIDALQLLNPLNVIGA